MQITFHDRAPLEKVRRTADGRIAAVAKFARIGVQAYTGAEVGRPDLTTVNVYRPESEVFDQAAMASFAHKAITLGHPAGAVTADNWKQHSVGWTEGKVARDGDYVEIPLMLADASAVRAYDSGEARELSGGYACELVWGDGVAPDGTPYQATQRQIRGNHIAQVPHGRAGSLARIGDAKVAPASIDAAFKEAVEVAAKGHNMKGSDWLAQASPKEVEQLVASVAQKFVSSAGGAGISAAFNVDSLAADLQTRVLPQMSLTDMADRLGLEVSMMRAAHSRKFAFMGDSAPKFDEGAARLAAQVQIETYDAGVRDTIRAAQFG